MLTTNSCSITYILVSDCLLLLLLLQGLLL
jgi:hypothetical protein